MSLSLFDKCILCGSDIRQVNDPEHVIPEYLDGRLKAVILCKKCNHGIGAKLYSEIKKDTYIRRAGFLFSKKLPKIFASIEDQQVYKTYSPVGVPLKAMRREGIVKLVGQKKDNWLVLPTNDAIEYLKKRLNNDKSHTLDDDFSKIPNDKLTRISSDYSIIRWDADKFAPDFTSNGLLDRRSVLLIAYEYLALQIGSAIYDPVFNDIREEILQNKKKDSINVNFFTTDKAQPFHLIYPEYLFDKIKIHIHLFEYHITIVELLNIRIVKKIPDLCYLEDLIKRKSYGAMSVAEGKANQWYEFIF